MNHRLAAIVLAALLANLSGCLSQGSRAEASGTAVEALPAGAFVNATAVPPRERYFNATQQDLDFTSRDGTTIRSTVYLPSQPRPGFEQQATFGAVVHFSPYYTTFTGDTDSRMNSVRGNRTLNETGWFGRLVTHGFAFVAASVPGTGYSSGCFDLGGQHEQTVMAEFVDWVGEQLWSNGNVGMGGPLYASAAQWMTAIHQPKHLKTIVPESGVVDWYNLAFQDGAPFIGPDFIPVWEGAYAFGIDGGDFESVIQDPKPENLRPPSANPIPETLADRLCPEVAEHFTSTARSYATGAYNAFWQERDYTQHLDRIQASVLLVHGLQDWSAMPVQSLVWDSIRPEKTFWLQQMSSYGPTIPTPGLNESWARPDFYKTFIAWFDHYLNGASNGIPETLPPVQVQDQTGHWREESRWPPAGVQEHRLYLGNAALLEEPPATGQTIFVTPANAQQPTGSQETVAARDAPNEVVAKFLSPVLERPLRFSGEARLDLGLSVDRPGYGHVVAELWRIQANGTWEFLSMGGTGLAQRDGRDQDDPPQPLEALQVPVRLQAADVFLDAGERLALTLSGENRWFEANGHAPVFMLKHGSTLTLPELPQDTPRGIDTAAMIAQSPYYDEIGAGEGARP